MTEITVRGSHTSVHPPEVANVQARVRHESADMSDAYARVADELTQVQASLTDAQQAGSLTTWSAAQIHTWTYRQTTADGEPSDQLTYQCQVDIEATFTDFPALSTWVREQTVREQAGPEQSGFGMDRISWELTDERRLQVWEQAETLAVQDAQTRAQRYADALELGPVKPVAIADPGMLSGSVSGCSDNELLYGIRAGSSSRQAEIIPADVEVTRSVDARFTTGS